MDFWVNEINKSYVHFYKTERVVTICVMSQQGIDLIFQTFLDKEKDKNIF